MSPRLVVSVSCRMVSKLDVSDKNHASSRHASEYRRQQLQSSLITIHFKMHDHEHEQARAESTSRQNSAIDNIMCRDE